MAMIDNINANSRIVAEEKLNASIVDNPHEGSKTYRTNIIMEPERPVSVITTARSRSYKVTGVCLGLMCVLLLPAITAMHVTLETDQLQTSCFRIGDRVRVKASVSSPKHGWGEVSHKSVGVISALDGASLTVDFPEHKSWTAAVSEMELAPNVVYFRVGDRVRVKASVSSPKRGWGEVSHKSVGVVTALDGEKMTVDFPEHKSWTAAASEMELAPNVVYFRVGDRVRVKASVSSPKHGWGEVSHTSVGVITALDGEKMTVDFPKHKSWTAAASEMELAPNVETLRVGDRVRVKASVTTPTHNWGGVSHKSVGVVTEVDGESLIVDFPEHKSWKAAVSEMELLPSAEFCKFKPGDKVRVKASVETPKYQWGSASHKSVGTIKVLKMEVDFPEHSGWTADPSEIELAP